MSDKLGNAKEVALFSWIRTQANAARKTAGVLITTVVGGLALVVGIRYGLQWYRDRKAEKSSSTISGL